jgi:hypothetical protein
LVISAGVKLQRNIHIMEFWFESANILAHCTLSTGKLMIVYQPGIYAVSGVALFGRMAAILLPATSQ